VAEALGPLAERIVFIGGAVAPLLQTHPVSSRVRPTKDVDGLAVTASYAEFTTLEEELRARDFRQLAMDARATQHAHRWITPTGGVFDLVPVGRHLGGSGNSVGQAAVDSAVTIALSAPHGGTTVIRHVNAPTFLALKWAAFRDRGDRDLLASHDVEDMFAVLASRPSLPSECVQASADVQMELRAMADLLLGSEDLLGEALQAHLVVDARHDRLQVQLNVRDHLRSLATRP
jgi:hypothetical protein